MPLIGLNWLITCWAFSGLLQKSAADCFSRKDSRCFFLPRMSKRVPQEAQTVGKILHLFFGFRVHRAHPGEFRQSHQVQPAVIPPACSIRKILGLAPGQSNRPSKRNGSGIQRSGWILGVLLPGPFVNRLGGTGRDFPESPEPDVTSQGNQGTIRNGRKYSGTGCCH